MEDEEIAKEQQKQAILEKINNELKKLGSDRLEKWPEGLEKMAKLEGKTVVMVDDMLEILQMMVPALTVATEGKANFILYQGQELKKLLDEILANNPNLVILDYDLSGQFKGTEILRALQAAGFQGDTVGFTGDEAAAIQFKDMGAAGCLDKNTESLYWPEKRVDELSDLIEKKNKNR